MKKYKFKVEDLECANCALEVENHLNSIDGINNCHVNFTKLTMNLETDYEGNVKQYIEKLSKEAEPNIKVLDIDENSNNKKLIIQIIRLTLGLILSGLGMYFENNLVILLAYLTLLSNCIINSIKLLIKSHTINENLLITISCFGAYILGEIHEGLMVVILYEIGKILETLAVNNSRRSISKLMDIKPEYANLKTTEGVDQVTPEEVKINDVIIVKKGEKIPLDGIIIKGASKLNTSALTGESKLRSVEENDEVLSGSINEGNIIEIKVTKDYENSTVSRILDLVENASDRKSVTENFVSKASKVYTPIVILSAITAFIVMNFFINSIDTETAIYRALSFLVVSCPCAIAISVPLAYFTGIGTASKKGILIKGSDYLDNIRLINEIIFDKTGTITTGEFIDYKLEILNDNYKEKDIIEYYLKGESFSTHPIAKSIIDIFDKKINTKDITNFKEVAGNGLEYKINDDTILIGSARYVKSKTQDSSIYLKINKDIVAKLDLKDGLKKDSKEAISKLKKLGIKTMMFTGDEKEVALEIAEKIKIDEVKYELLPEDKYELLKEEIIKNSGKTAFIGDGINDAPSIRLADIGISMGNVGSASAIEASDVVISNDELSKIIDAIKISKYTNKIIIEDLVFSLGTKLIVLVLCALGITGMMAAVFADTGVTVLAILNTTRILKIK